MSKRIARSDVPKVLGYVVKPYWGSRVVYEAVDGSIDERKGRRIPPRDLAIWLLWLDQFNINDVSMLIGLSVKQGRIIGRA